MILNNYGQQAGIPIRYEETQSGPLNDAVWTVTVYRTSMFFLFQVFLTGIFKVNNYEYGKGHGRTLAQAKEEAAKQALATIQLRH